MFGLFKRSQAVQDVPQVDAAEERSFDTGNGGWVAIDGTQATAPTINTRSPFTIAAYWQGVSMISADVARLPLLKFERLPQNGPSAKTWLWDDPVQDLVLRTASQHQQAYYFWRTVMTDAVTWNHSLSWIRRENGVPVEMIPLIPTLTRWDPMQGLYFTAISRSGDQMRQGDRELVALFPDEVFHIIGLQSAGWIPELVTQARNTFALAKAAESFNIQFFSSGAQTSGILEVPASMTKKAVDNLEEGFRDRTKPDSLFRTIVLRDGAKFHSTSVDPEKSQTHELREDQVREIARWLCLPPSKLGLSDSVSYNSRAEDNRAYYEQAVIPWLEAIASEANTKLLTQPERTSRLRYFEHDKSSINAGDPKTQSDIGLSELAAGVISVNEYRARRNMNPIDGGDSYPGDETNETTSEEVRSVYRQAVRDASNVCLKRIHQESGRKSWDRFCDWFANLDSDWFQQRTAPKLETAHQAVKTELRFDQVAREIEGAVRMDVERLLNSGKDREEFRVDLLEVTARWNEDVASAVSNWPSDEHVSDQLLELMKGSENGNQE